MPRGFVCLVITLAKRFLAAYADAVMRHFVCTILMFCLLLQPAVVLAGGHCCSNAEMQTCREAVTDAPRCCASNEPQHVSEPSNDSDSNTPEQQPCSCPAGTCCVRVVMSTQLATTDLHVWTLPRATYALTHIELPPLSASSDITVPPPQNLPTL